VMKERGKMGIVWYGDEENEGEKDDEVAVEQGYVIMR
jgi:hypothetical protein